MGTPADEREQAGRPMLRRPPEPLPLTWWERRWRETVFNLLSLPLALLAFVVGVTGLAVGVATSPLLVGLGVLVLTAYAGRVMAHAERIRIRRILGRPCPTPDYLRADPEDRWRRRVLTSLRDAQSWLDLSWMVLGFVTGLLAFVVTVVWWAAVAGGLTYWFWQQFLPQPGQGETLAALLGLGEGRRPEIWLNTFFGLVALVTLPWAVRSVAALHAGLARLLLSGRAELQAEVSRAQTGRAAARVAEASALRRLERDIHDGPQQRLIRLSMDLGRARKQLESDPDAVRVILDEALANARGTVEDLRALSRGIAPPVLVDRGLVAALEEAAVRCPVPVETRLEVPAGLAPYLETAVYFVVSECLANVAKHSQATRAGIAVKPHDGWLRVEVVDDGQGGAHPGKGHGLAGLEQRVLAADGTLTVVSPPGGPTRITAEVPCA